MTFYEISSKPDMTFYEITLQNRATRATFILRGGEFKNSSACGDNVGADRFDTRQEAREEIDRLKKDEYPRGTEFVLWRINRDPDELAIIYTDIIPAPAPSDES